MAAAQSLAMGGAPALYAGISSGLAASGGYVAYDASKPKVPEKED